MSGYVFFGMIFLLFCFYCLLFAFAVDVCSFFVARELMRTRGVGCGNASGPTSGTPTTWVTTSSGILYLRYWATNENITVKRYQDSMLTERLFIHVPT